LVTRILSLFFRKKSIPCNKPQNVTAVFAPCGKVDNIVEPVQNFSNEDRKYFPELLRNEPENDPLFIPSYEDDISIEEELKSEEMY